MVRLPRYNNGNAWPILWDVAKFGYSILERLFCSGDLVASQLETLGYGVFETGDSRTFTESESCRFNLYEHHQGGKYPEPVNTPTMYRSIDDLRVSKHFLAKGPKLTSHICLSQSSKIVRVRLSKYAEAPIIERPGAYGRQNESCLRRKQTTVRHF